MKTNMKTKYVATKTKTKRK